MKLAPRFLIRIWLWLCKKEDKGREGSVFASVGEVLRVGTAGSLWLCALQGYWGFCTFAGDDFAGKQVCSWGRGLGREQPASDRPVEVFL